MRACWSKPVVPVLVAGLLFTACNQKPSEPVEVPRPPKPVRQPAAEAPLAPAEVPPPVTLKELQSSPEFADMNTLVDAFYDRHKRLPTLAELTRSFGRPLPEPPAGHMFVIDQATRKVKVIPVR